MFRPWWCAALLAAFLPVAVADDPSPDDEGDKPAKKDKPTKKPAKDDDDSDDPLKKFPPFDKFTKGAEVITGGLLTLYKKDNSVYLELEQQHLNKPYLLPVAVARGAGMGGDTLNFGEEWVVLFKRVAPDTVQLVRRNTRYRAEGNVAASKAVEQQYLDSVLMALPVKTINPSKGAVLVDLNPVFFSDFGQFGLGSPDASRTTWGKVKAFKKNVELEVQATFPGRSFSFFGGGFFGGPDGVIDSRGITVVLHYGLCEMPENGYQPRYADSRVGHFLTAVKDFAKDNPDTSFVRMINRWRLERADGSTWKEGGKLVPPKKRIVYWIEDTVPDEYRTAVREGILEWNKAFERVGFKDAIEVRQQDGQEFDPEDVTYATFRWTTRDYGGAIGPSRANPLTGEIIDADILFDGGFVQLYKQEFKLFRDDSGRPLEPGSLIQAQHKGWDLPFHPLAFRGSPFGWNDRAGEPPVPPEARLWQRLAAGPRGYCQCATHKRGELALAGFAAVAVLAADADDDADPGKKKKKKKPAAEPAAADKPKPKDGDKPKPDADDKDEDDDKPVNKELERLLQQAIKEIAMHEVGHTLGLRHNFKASTMLANSQLHDTEITRKKGLVGSVMDYSPANIAPPGAKQGDYFTTTLGPYDYWAIEYAYRPVGGGSDGEKAELEKVAKKVAQPDLVYGTDEDLYGSADPFIGLWDLGRDPLQFGRDRIKLAEGLMGKLADTAVDKGESYARLRMAFSMLLYQYGDAAYLASRYVGGTVVSRDHKGDPDGRDPLAPVAGDKQREALALLQKHILTDKPFQFPPALLRKLGQEKWYHWGSNDFFFGAGGEFPVNQRVLGIQRIALDELLDGATLGRIQNQARTAAKGDKPLTVAEVFRALSDSVFADLKKGEDKAESSVVSRNLQRAYVQKLAELVLGPKSDFGRFFFVFRSSGGGEVPADAKALARLHLKEAGERVTTALKGESDDTAKAHLLELQERIAKVLDARPAVNE